MGLLDDLPDSLLKLIRTAAQNRNPNVDLGADNAIDLPSWVPQRPPLSLAGPGLAADINVSSPGPSRPADPLRAQPPAPTAQNLTTQALRIKGVPDADIAAATGNPERMKQLIIQHYGPRPAQAPANIGYAPYANGTNRGLDGDSGQRFDPQTGGLDDNRARRDAPGWGRVISGDPTGFNDPSGLLAGPRPGHDPKPSSGPIQPQPVGFECEGFPA